MSGDPVGSFLYFSELLSRTVVDAAGKPIGKLWDLSIELPEPYPSVRQLFIRPPGQADLLLVAEGSQVRSWTESPIPLTARVPELRPSRRREEAEILLREALLDKQVVDVSGAKVERVNDLHFLAGARGQLVLAHIDVGLRGPRAPARLGARHRGRRAPRAAARALPRRRGGAHRLEVRRPDAGRPGRACASRSRRSRSRASIRPTSRRSSRTCRRESRRSVFDALEFQTAARVLPEVDPEDAAGAAHGRERSRARRGPARERCRPTPRPTSFPRCRRRTRRT